MKNIERIPFPGLLKEFLNYNSYTIMEDGYRKLFKDIELVQEKKEKRSCRIGVVYINIESLEKQQPNLIGLRMRQGRIPKEGIYITLLELTEGMKEYIIEEIKLLSKKKVQ